jgi:hypothetical protein
MKRFAPTVVAALLLSGCASSSSSAPPIGDGSPPWSSLTSPTAALTVVLDEICLPAIMDGRPIRELAEARYLRPVPPESTGSPSAVAAWRLASWHHIYVMELPNGGCSFSLEAGEADDLAAETVNRLKARADFAPGRVAPTADGNGENTAWCTPEMRRPVVAGVLRRTGGRRVALLVNVFRAEDARPSFCPLVAA